MRILPYRKLEWSSRLSAAEALAALSRQVEPRRWLRLSYGPAMFLGTVEGSNFEIERAIQYRNSFLPQVRGTVRQAANGCTISMTMALHPFVLAFAAVWLSLAGTAALIFLASALAERSLSPPALIPAGMFALFVLMATASFAYEARKTEKLLKEIFVAEG